MHKYDEYKNSDIEWIGQIPSHWNIIRLKYLCSIETGDKDTINAVDDGVYPFFVRSQTIEKINSYTKDCEAVLTAGDGVGVGKVFHYINGKFDFHQRVYMFNKFKHITGKYFFTYLVNNFYKVVLDGNAKNTVDSLRLPLIANFIFTIPPIYEQYEIDNYLDQQTAKIDDLIHKQNKLIELLQEKKKSLINHVVTKGLNSDVQMKDSGIEWLGYIPEHWEVKKLKHLVVISNGQDYKHVEDDEGIYPVIGSGGEFARSKAYLYSGESILLGRKGTIDKPLYFIGKFWTVDTMFYTRILPISCGKFVYYQCINIDFNRYITSTALPSMTQLDLNNISLASPTFKEQQQIAEYLDQQTAKIDELTNKAKSMVELLKEHKQSLINNVVTGKIKVI